MIPLKRAFWNKARTVQVSIKSRVPSLIMSTFKDENIMSLSGLMQPVSTSELLASVKDLLQLATLCLVALQIIHSTTKLSVASLARLQLSFQDPHLDMLWWVAIGIVLRQLSWGVFWLSLGFGFQKIPSTLHFYIDFPRGGVYLPSFLLHGFILRGSFEMNGTHWLSSRS